MRYYRPSSLEEALSLLSTYGETGLAIGGGTFFVPHREELFSEVEALVDLQKVGLDYIKLDSDGLRIGATTTLTSMLASDFINSGLFRVISETVRAITPLEVRNMATIGGDICLSAEADLPTTLIALGAEVIIASQKGTRTLPLEKFYPGYLQNALGLGEIVTEIRVPYAPPKTGAAFYKFKRRAVDLPVLNAAAQITLGHDDKCTSAKIVLGCARDIPVRASIAEKLLIGNKCDDVIVESVAESTGDITYITDIRASSELRKVWGKVAVRTVLKNARERAKGLQ